MKKLTIGIVVRNHFEQTEKCIRSLAEHTDSSKYKLIVFDNGSTEPTNQSFVVDFCATHDIECKYQFSSKNEGYNARQNQLYDMCDTELALICHQDVVFSPQWLENMVRRFDDHLVAGVGPCISFALGVQSENIAHLTFNSDIKFLVGLFFMARVDVLRKVKETFGEGKWYVAPAYGVLGDKEELELCYRIRQLGFELKVARDVHIEHEGEKNFIDTLGSQQKFWEYQNNQKKILVDRLGEDVVNDIYAIRITKPIKLMIGILTRTEYVHYRNYISMLKIWGMTNVQKDFYHIGRSHPAIARNQILKAFLQGDWTHVLFVDDDMTFEHDAVNKLIARDVDIVTGMAWQRGEPHAPCVFLADEVQKTLYPLEVKKQGLVEIDTMGAYFSLTKRRVIEKVGAPWYKYGDTSLGYNPRKGDMGEEEAGIGEDVYFGLKCRKAGFNVFVDSDVIIGHIGQEEVVDDKYVDEYKASGKQEEFLANKFRKM